MSAGSEWVPRMRSRAEIEDMAAWLKANPMDNGGPAYQRGAADLLLWTLGRKDAGPVTGRVVPQPVTRTEVSDEAYEATTALYNGGRAAVGDLSTQYLLGVEHYGSWLVGGDAVAVPAGWPYPAEAPPVPR